MQKDANNSPLLFTWVDMQPRFIGGYSCRTSTDIPEKGMLIAGALYPDGNNTLAVSLVNWLSTAGQASSCLMDIQKDTF